jgi:hypothetical protein
MSTNSEESPGRKSADGPLAQQRRWTDADGVHIDVRGLLPPGPLVAILELVESIGERVPIIVHHDRDPKLLYPELAELGWIAVPIDAPAGEVRLKLERAS